MSTPSRKLRRVEKRDGIDASALHEASASALLPLAAKVGMLSKRSDSGLIHTTKNRHFLLHGTLLYYFESPDSTKPKGVIELKGATLERATLKKGEAAIKLSTRTRVFVLSSILTSSAEARAADLDSWFDLLTDASLASDDGETSRGGNRDSAAPLSTASTGDPDLVTPTHASEGGGFSSVSGSGSGSGEEGGETARETVFVEESPEGEEGSTPAPSLEAGEVVEGEGGEGAPAGDEVNMGSTEAEIIETLIDEELNQQGGGEEGLEVETGGDGEGMEGDLESPGFPSTPVTLEELHISDHVMSLIAGAPEEVQIAWLNLTEAAKKAGAAERANKALTAAVAGLTKERNELRGAVVTMEQHALYLEAQAGAAAEKLEGADGVIEELEAKVGELTAANATLENEVAASRALAKTLKGEKEALNKTIEGLRGELAAAKAAPPTASPVPQTLGGGGGGDTPLLLGLRAQGFIV